MYRIKSLINSAINKNLYFFQKNVCAQTGVKPIFILLYGYILLIKLKTSHV